MTAASTRVSTANNGRVYLVDASIYVYRGFRELRSTVVDRQGVQSNAVHGFVASLLQLFESERPQYLACAFDPANNAGSRRAIDPLYKANRKTRPPELVEQFARCQQWCEAIGVAAYERSGCEADDVIAALANVSRRARLPVTVVTADKDLAQLIRVGDELWELSSGRRLQYGRLSKRLGLKPEQVADMLALCGDKTDNILGVPGLGSHAAARLLVKWGDLANLGENLDAVAEMKFKGAATIAPVLKEHWSQVLASRKLTGVLPVDDMPESPSDLLVREPGDWQALANTFALTDADIARWQAVLN